MSNPDFHTGSLFNSPSPVAKEPVLSPQQLRAQAMAGTPKDRQIFSLSVRIDVEGFRLASIFMERLLDSARRTKSPGGLWLLGEGGSGKTFALTSFAERHPHVTQGVIQTCEVLRLPFEGRPAESDIWLGILLQLGQNPDALLRLSNKKLKSLVYEATEQATVRVILFDEAQHLFISSSASGGKRSKDRLGGPLADVLKRFYDKSGVAYVFAGTPGLRDYVERDPQVNTRWPAVRLLEEFQYDEKFIGALAVLDVALPMEEPAGLSEPELSKQIFASSQGNFRLLKNFLAKAVFIAASAGSKSIERKHFQQGHFETYCEERTPYGFYSPTS